jgi:hypothetical protein
MLKDGGSPANCSPVSSAMLGGKSVLPPTPFAPGRSHQPCGGFGGPHPHQLAEIIEAIDNPSRKIGSLKTPERKAVTGAKLL